MSNIKEPEKGLFMHY